MGPFRCSVAGCAYVSIRRYEKCTFSTRFLLKMNRECVLRHIRRALRGPQQGGHVHVAPFRCPAMSLALQQESGLCLLPHTVPWSSHAAAAGAPFAAPPVAPAFAVPPLPGPSAAINVTVAPSGNDLDTVDHEDEETDDEDDDLEPSPLVSVRSILIDKIVDLIYKAVIIGCYYTERIDGLDIPEGTHKVVGSDGRRIEVDPAGMQRNASEIIGHAIEVLNTAADGLKDDNLQEDELEGLATSTCEAISQIPVALTWYLRNSSNAGDAEEDMAKLASMQQAIVNEFDTVEEDEDEMEEDGDDE